jgi:putative transposon-encoded protein
MAMVKIRITGKEHEIEGKIVNGIVKPFGTSAHIPFKKEYTGRHIKIIIPEDDEYAWIFSEEELKRFVKEGRNAINKHVGKMRFYYLDGLERIKENRFSKSDISVVCDALEKEKKCLDLVKKIRKEYG